jgi:predicted nucleic acid-binding protein
MNVVVDANIIFSSLLIEKSRIRNFLLDERFSFFSPDYLMMELLNKQERLLKYTSMEKQLVDELFRILVQKIHFVKEDFVSTECRNAALELCRGVDETDVPYVALAIEMNYPLWTGDEKLKKGLRKKGFYMFFDLPH